MILADVLPRDGKQTLLIGITAPLSEAFSSLVSPAPVGGEEEEGDMVCNSGEEEEEEEEEDMLEW